MLRLNDIKLNFKRWFFRHCHMNKRHKYLIDFLRTFDGTGLSVAIYDSISDEPFWTGTYSSIPWWIAEAELDFSDGESPVDFRYNFDIEGNPGIVIRIK